MTAVHSPGTDLPLSPVLDQDRNSPRLSPLPGQASSPRLSLPLGSPRATRTPSPSSSSNASSATASKYMVHPGAHRVLETAIGQKRLSPEDLAEGAAARERLQTFVNGVEEGYLTTLLDDTGAVSAEEAFADEPTEVVVVTDPGQDMDDEMAMILMRTLVELEMVACKAVVTNLCPPEARARLARGTLDELGMADVPVGVGTAGGSDRHKDTFSESAAGYYPAGKDVTFVSGEALLVKALEAAAPFSLTLLCISSLTDAAALIRDHEALFVAKVSTVCIMGGVLPFDADGGADADADAAAAAATDDGAGTDSGAAAAATDTDTAATATDTDTVTTDTAATAAAATAAGPPDFEAAEDFAGPRAGASFKSGPRGVGYYRDDGVPVAETFLEPDTAQNNMFDEPSAALVYSRCQELRVRLVVVSRHTAYACKVPRSIYDELVTTGSPIGKRLHGKQRDAIEDLWRRACAPAGPQRLGLPMRCDKSWFTATFCGGLGADRAADESIWDLIRSFNMYDPLALCACVPRLRRRYFDATEKTVRGITHLVMGVGTDRSGVSDVEGLRDFLVWGFFEGIMLNHRMDLIQALGGAHVERLRSLCEVHRQRRPQSQQGSRSRGASRLSSGSGGGGQLGTQLGALAAKSGATTLDK